MYIGDKKIKAQFEQENKTDLKLEFDDGSDVVINAKLFDLIKSKVKNDGNITDSINHYFAKKFVAELAYYNLDFYFANNIGVAMGTLSHNLREELFKKAFDCSGAETIKLGLLLSLDKEQ